jgi:histidinol-phosphate aminotransferase
MIKHSPRLKNVHRVFDPYSNRDGFVRLDRNEDPVGYALDFFNAWKSQISIDDVAAYADSTPLVQRLSKWLGFQESEIYISAGSDALIKNIFEVYIDEGDTVLMQKPSWRMYDVYCTIYGATPEYVSYAPDFSFNVEEIKSALRNKKIKMLILANPNQPTGTMLPAEDIKSVIALAHERGTLVVMDEAYYLFSKETSAELVRTYDNLIVARTFSKAFGIAGLRLGYAIANAQRIKDLMLVRPVTDANSLAINFASYLLDNMSVVEAKIADFNAGRDYLFDQLSKAGVPSHQSHGNFILIPCPDEAHAKNIIAFARDKKYTLKGPFREDPINNCVRVSTGSLQIMQAFWKDCGDNILLNAIKKKG